MTTRLHSSSHFFPTSAVLMSAVSAASPSVAAQHISSSFPRPHQEHHQCSIYGSMSGGIPSPSLSVIDGGPVTDNVQTAAQTQMESGSTGTYSPQATILSCDCMSPFAWKTPSSSNYERF